MLKISGAQAMEHLVVFNKVNVVELIFCYRLYYNKYICSMWFLVAVIWGCDDLESKDRQCQSDLLASGTNLSRPCYTVMDKKLIPCKVTTLLAVIKLFKLHFVFCLLRWCYDKHLQTTVDGVDMDSTKSPKVLEQRANFISSVSVELERYWKFITSVLLNNV